MTIKTSKWTSATINKLRDLYLNKEHSASEIAKVLGFTKNAIIGKIHRLNLNEEKSAVTNKLEVTSIIPKGKYKLEQINYNMCVWPSEEKDKDENEKQFLFCGQPVVNGKSYCAEHVLLVYLTSKKAAVNNNIYRDDEETENTTEEATEDTTEDTTEET